MEQAIKKFLQQLEKQEKKGFKDSWQVTRPKNVNFCQKLKYELHTNTTNMQKYAPPTLLMVPRCLAAASGRGSDSDGCNASQEAFCSGTLCG